MNARVRKWLAAVLIVAALVWGGSLVAKRLLPLELSELESRWDLWRGGVRTHRMSGLRVFERNHCKGTDCVCILLVHGLGDVGMTWKRLLLMPGDRWPEEVRLLAPDLPGTGGSPAPQSPSLYRVRRQAELLDQMMDGVQGCDARVVVGHSMGGWIAAWMAIERPEKVERLVLVGAAGLKRYRSTESGMLTTPTVESLQAFQRKAYHRPRPLPDYVWRAVAKRAALGNSSAVVGAQLPADDLDDRLEQIRVPTVVFWGREDGIIPVAAGEEFAKRVPEATLHVEPECGHLAHKECLSALHAAVAKAL